MLFECYLGWRERQKSVGKCDILILVSCWFGSYCFAASSSLNLSSIHICSCVCALVSFHLADFVMVLHRKIQSLKPRGEARKERQDQANGNRIEEWWHLCSLVLPLNVIPVDVFVAPSFDNSHKTLSLALHAHAFVFPYVLSPFLISTSSFLLLPFAYCSPRFAFSGFSCGLLFLLPPVLLVSSLRFFCCFCGPRWFALQFPCPSCLCCHSKVLSVVPADILLFLVLIGGCRIALLLSPHSRRSGKVEINLTLSLLFDFLVVAVVVMGQMYQTQRGKEEEQSCDGKKRRTGKQLRSRGQRRSREEEVVPMRDDLQKQHEWHGEDERGRHECMSNGERLSNSSSCSESSLLIKIA